MTTHDKRLSAVLVANRGEIALRVFRACKELGIRTIGVFSEADRGAPWLRLADDAYLLGPAPPTASYLNIERILQVARTAGADAIHPGYGFLSENADFARAVTGAGFVWVGPPVTAIRRMGDKLSARAAARHAGVPLVPGTLEPTENEAVVRRFAAEHGMPVAIKAAFGGGGRGMRIVRETVELTEALESARREATAAFGRGEVYLERYLERPRHIEAQILADHHGSCLFLGERDCSIQRRHQKLIEEAPAPGLEPGTREELGAAAVAIGREVDYASAGTVEFLYADGRFYFLEMNTRLQVEHGVTELVTGIDLVAWQMRIASGEPLPWSQSDIRARGHAIEARINAEQVTAGFLPTGGRITNWVAPGGPGVRVDAGVAIGSEIPTAYDSLIAKLIAFGSDREDARRKLLRACEEFQIAGVPTTLDFHRFALAHPDFRSAAYSTVSVEHDWDLSALPGGDAAVPSDGPPEPSRVLTVEVDGKSLEVALFEPRADTARPRRSRHSSAGSRAPTSSGVADQVAPLQGTVVKVALQPGAPVASGDLVLVLDAMKMENDILAHRDGVLSAVHVAEGEVVNQGDRLFVIEAPPDS